MSIGERIQELRKTKYMSQEELAEKVEVSKQSVSKWELDKTLPNIEKILKLCDIFGISADYLLRGEEAESQNVDTENENCIEKKIPRVKKKHIIMLVVSSIITICLMLAVCNIVIFNNMSISGNSKQDVAMVERIYTQYTKADIKYVNSENNFVTDTVYLDLNGVDEGDWIFCYPDDKNPDIIRFKYSRETCIRLVAAFVVSLGITISSIIILIHSLKCADRHQKEQTGSEIDDANMHS